MINPICPTCSKTVPIDLRGGARCAECGIVVAQPFTACPQCGRVNEPGVGICTGCATDLTAACPGCGQMNWSGAEACSGCGREMDLLAHAFRPVNASYQHRQQELLQRVPLLKEKEERESQLRLETLREADRRRAQRAAEAAEQARVRQQRIILAVGIALIGFVIFVLLTVFILM